MWAMEVINHMSTSGIPGIHHFFLTPIKDRARPRGRRPDTDDPITSALAKSRISRSLLARICSLSLSQLMSASRWTDLPKADREVIRAISGGELKA